MTQIEAHPAPTPQPRFAARLSSVAPALRWRNFRLFWFGQLISTAGTSLQVVAEGWLVYEVTQSTFWLGMVGLLALIPVLPISLAGGVLIDRVPRRKLIIVTQSCLLLQAAAFGVLALSGRLQLWHIVLLYFIFGAVLAIDHPARRAFLVELVGPDDLANAVALNATLFNFASLIGYSAAGLLIAAVGAGAAMLVNAASYTATIGALLLIRTTSTAADRVPAHGARTPFLAAAVEGAVTLWRQPTLLGAVGVMAVVGGLAAPVFSMMPAYAEEVMGTGAVGLGVLMAAGALGSLLGTAAIARLGSHRRGRTLTLTSLLLPLLIAGFALAPSMLGASLLLVAIGGSMLILQSLAITLVQLHIPDRVRGRVMSIYSITHAGSDTLGAAAVGTLAALVGLPVALCIGAGLALAFALGMRGALPDVARLD